MFNIKSNTVDTTSPAAYHQVLPVIAGVQITADAEGRFNLNALHKASGLGEHKRPSKWLATNSAKEIIAELEANLLKSHQSPNSGLAQELSDGQICPSVLNVVKGGLNQGTFAHELLAISYADRFVEGKHYFKVTGAELKEMKHRLSLSESVKIARNVNSLILWTERGAARHAKMLETDQAWDVFEKLEDCYFSHRNKDKKVLFNGRIVLYVRNNFIDMAQAIDDSYHIGSFDSWRELATRAGWLVINPDEPIKNLVQNLPALN